MTGNAIPESNTHWGIVGGGILGSVLALRLAQQGQRVTLLEAQSSLGGLASPWQINADSEGAFEWDRYYHVTLLSDFQLRELLAELDLTEQLNWRQTRTSFYTGQALHPLNDVIDYLRLPALGMMDKARLAFTILYASRIEDGQPLESLSAEAWLTKLSGERTYRNLWLPLIRSKLGDNAPHASAAYIWSVIRRFYGARRGGLQKEMFGYVTGGYKTILEALERKLQQLGTTLLTGVKVNHIQQQDQQLTVSYSSDNQPQQLSVDRIINTCASPIAAAMTPQLSDVEQQQHQGLLYQGIVCASVLLKRPLAGAYLAYITDQTIPFTSVIEMSSLVPPSELQGHHLVYLPRYVPATDPLLNASDEEIEAQFIPALLRMYPGLCEDDISAFKVARTRHVLAIATQNYSKQLPAMATSVPGLYIINSAQIRNAALSVNDTIALANQAAQTVLGATAESEASP